MKGAQHMKMTKTQAKQIAREMLQSVIGCTYYRLENEDYSEEEKDLINQYLHILGERACKAIGTEYVSY